MENKNELENKSADIDGAQIETAVKPAENVREKYLFMKGKKRNSKTLIILGAILFFAIAIAGAYFINMNRLPKKSPQEIIKSSMETMSKAKTYTYSGNMKIDALIKPKLTNTHQSSYSQDMNLTYNIAMSGKADQTDINNPKASTNMKLDMDFSGEGGSQKFYLDLDAVSVGQKGAYYKLNDYDLGMMGMMIGPQISQYKGKWYMLDMEEMKKMAEADSTTPMYSFGLEDYDISKIEKLFEKYELMKFQKDLGDTKLGSIDVYHYQLRLDGVAIANFYIDLLKEMEPKSENEISKKSLEEMLRDFKDGVEKYKSIIDKIVNNINIEVWIGKNDRLMYKVKMDGKFDKKFLEMIEKEIITKEELDSEMLESEDRPSKSLDDVGISFDAYFNMSDFNKPVNIEEPKEAESLLKVFKEMGRGLSTYNNPYDSMPESDLDMDGLTDYMEEFYGTDKNNPDTDGDGYKDGEEVKNGYDPALPGDARLER